MGGTILIFVTGIDMILIMLIYSIVMNPIVSSIVIRKGLRTTRAHTYDVGIHNYPLRDKGGLNLKLAMHVTYSAAVNKVPYTLLVRAVLKLLPSSS
jgi:hypothetical protein